MSFFDKKQFAKNLRRLTSAPALGIYDEDTEDPIGVLPEEEDSVNSDLETNEITPFVNTILMEIKQLGQYKINGVVFELNVQGHHIIFKVETKEANETKETNENLESNNNS